MAFDLDPARFWAKVQKTDGCWFWTASVSAAGYGVIGKSRGGRATYYAHRVTYEMLIGEIPEGLVIDHLCRNRACVNPAHLEPVTDGENTRRGDAPVAQVLRTNRCQRGHTFDETNTYVVPSSGKRRCRECVRISQRKVA